MTDPFDKTNPGANAKIPDLAPEPKQHVSDRPSAANRPSNPVSVKPTSVKQGESTELELMPQGVMLELDVGFSGATKSLGLAQQSNWPTGSSPRPESIAPDPIEARIQSEYGEEPGNVFETLPYALRVYLRRRELRQEIVQSASRVQSAEARRDELLARVAEACRSGFSADFASVFSNLVKVETLVGERQAALSGVNVEHEAALKGLEEKHQAMDARAQALEADLPLKTEKFAEQDLNFSRAQAQYKRVLIEIRALKNAEEQARERGETVDHSQKVLELSHQAQTLRPGVVELEIARTQAQKEINHTQTLIARTREEATSIQAERQKLDKAFTDQLGLREEGVRQAQDERFIAAAEVGRSILALRGGIPLDEKTLEEIRMADAAVMREIKRQRTLEVAEHTYDGESYRRGKGIALGGIALLLLLLLFKIIF